MINAHQIYLDLVLQGHSERVKNFKPEIADPTILASNLLQMLAFVMLQGRTYSPYVLPCQWLAITRGTGDTFAAAIESDKSSLAICRAPNLSPFNDELFKQNNRQDFLYLLQRHESRSRHEPWDPISQEAFERTVSFIGGIKLAVQTHELSYLHASRIHTLHFAFFKAFVSKRTKADSTFQALCLFQKKKTIGTEKRPNNYVDEIKNCQPFSADCCAPLKTCAPALWLMSG